MTRPLTVMLVAAEASGDSLGAGLARALKARLGDGVRFVGVGGQKMAEQGVQSPFDIAQLSILGIIEGVRALPMVKRRVRETAALAAREKPDIAVLIDSWGFTLRVAHALRKLDPAIPLVKYVGPQVWAQPPWPRQNPGPVGGSSALHPRLRRPLVRARGPARHHRWQPHPDP